MNSEVTRLSLRASMSSLSSFEDLKDIDVDDEGLDSGVGSVFLPLQCCNKRKVRDPVVVLLNLVGLEGSRLKAEALLGEF
ncbi:hypothetical protein SO802_013348 [Lithocarpus litseifolius]|uniref:Uncharacterized protein n=1 Tax=Lithocarpus litseifolius TaxID=425828 RepID=A0AAW2D5Y3_9ROSI